MQIYNRLLQNKVPLKNIKFNSKENVANLIFIPEGKKTLDDYLKSEAKSLFGSITVPGVISSFVGKKLTSQKYYSELKTKLPNYKIDRIPSNDDKLTNVFDMSGISDEIIKISLSRSKKLVFSELNKLWNSVAQDYNKVNDNILFIYNPDGENINYLNLIKYIAVLNNNKIKSLITGIVYFHNNNFYPIAKKTKIKEVDYLVFNKSVIELLLKNIENINKGKEEVDEIDKNNIVKVRDKVNELSKKLSNKEEDNKKTISEIKKIVHGTPELNGTFQDKLDQLYKEDNDTPIDQISESLKKLNEKYNGNIEVNIKDKSAVNSEKIVGMKNLGNYNKQSQELNENMDANIKDLIDSTLLADPDLNIELISIKSKVVDNYKDRFKEYSIRIRHKNIGNTTNRPYNITFRTPIVVQDKYTRIGGNNYIMINQLFSAPIAKISPHLVRFYSHYSTAALELKSSRLSVNKDFKDIEDKFIQELKSVNAINNSKLVKFDNKLKDDIIMDYGIDDLSSFNYSKMEIKI